MLREREHGDVSSCLTTVYRWCVWTASAGPILTHKQHLFESAFFYVALNLGGVATLRLCFPEVEVNTFASYVVSHAPHQLQVINTKPLVRAGRCKCNDYGR